MEENYEFLPKNILNTLCLRVCQELPYLKGFDAATVWNEPIQFCRQIESNISEVDGVILTTTKDKGFYKNNNAYPLNSHLLLTRIYILLYYRHCDDKLYNSIVFPMLQKNMGIYKEKLNGIKEMIKNVLKNEQMIEQARQEMKKNVKPKYALIDLDESEGDEYFSKFSHEKLFCQLCDYLEHLKSNYFVRFDVTSIWITAKDVVKKLWQEIAPEKMIDRIFHKLSLNAGTGYVEDGAAEAVLLCSYAMMRSVSKSDHYQKAIEHFEKIPERNDDYNYLHEWGKYIKMKLDDGSISFDDYDYTGGSQKVDETFTREQVALIVQNMKSEADTLRQSNEDLTKRIEELEKENEQLKEQHKKTEEAEAFSTNEKTVQLEKEFEQLKTEREELIVDLLSGIFYSERNNVLEFLKKIDGKSDAEITDLVYEWSRKDVRKISDKSYKHQLWSILHAAKYYSATEQNWTAALRKRS